MARTIAEIYAEIITEKATYSNLNQLQPNINSLQSLLNQLTTPSRVAVWRLWAYLMAFGIAIHEQLLDVQTAEIEQRAQNTIPGTLRWYVDAAKAWQPGDQLTYDTNLKRYVYSVVNPSNTLVAYAAAVESNNQVIIKVAKENSGAAQQLTTAEENQLIAYFNLVKYAGTNLLVKSEAADEVKTTLTIFYDPLVLASNGESLSQSGVFPVEVAINNYLRDLGTVNFNGVLRFVDFVDAIQAAIGVVNVTVQTLEARYGIVPYANILTATGQEYQSDAGHLVIDPAFPLSSSITYTAV